MQLRVPRWAFQVLIPPVLLVSWLLVRGNPRTFTVLAAEVALPQSLQAFDNVAKVRAIRGNLIGTGTSSPCPVDSDEARPTCAIVSVDKNQHFELKTDDDTARFHSLLLTSEYEDKREGGCGIKLRADSRGSSALDLAWYAARGPCIARAEIVLLESEHAVHVTGLSAQAQALEALGTPRQPVALSLPLSIEQPLVLEYQVPDQRIGLWESKLELQALSFVAASPTTFSHRVGVMGAWEATCEAAPGSRVTFNGTSDSPLVLTRVDLTGAGLQLSFGVAKDWKLDTGTCQLSSQNLQRKAFLLLLLAQLGALGLLSKVFE